jgi:hypothetical protein
MSIYDDTPSHGRPLSYTEANKMGIMEAIAAGKYWKVSDDYTQIGHYQFVKPETQAKMATMILAELKTEIAKLPDPKTCSKEHCGDDSYYGVAAQIGVLRFRADMKFRESIEKDATQISEIEPTKQEPEPTPEPEVDESELTGAQKLQRARESVKGLIPSLNF